MEDTDAEDAELVRARKEGGDAWNRGLPRHFVRTYSIDEEAPEGEDMREGYDPSQIPARPPPPERAVSDDENNFVEERDRGQASSQSGTDHYAGLPEEENVWGRS